jgi:hypothetical protein
MIQKVLIVPRASRYFGMNILKRIRLLIEVATHQTYSMTPFAVPAAGTNWKWQSISRMRHQEPFARNLGALWCRSEQCTLHGSKPSLGVEVGDKRQIGSAHTGRSSSCLFEMAICWEEGAQMRTPGFQKILGRSTQQLLKYLVQRFQLSRSEHCLPDDWHQNCLTVALVGYGPFVSEIRAVLWASAVPGCTWAQTDTLTLCPFLPSKPHQNLKECERKKKKKKKKKILLSKTARSE